ncbi:MAG: hypothetical protein JWM31_3087 [Solirubrobacterales bacterium]|nr:hypothetical protein [Solirubrobacterales bacterium]
MIQKGVLDRVTATNLGTVVSADHSAGVTQLLVDFLGDFDEAGGWLLLNDALLAYGGTDEDNSLILLASPLPADAVSGDEVQVLTATGEPRVSIEAHVMIDAGEESVPHTIHSALEGRLTEDMQPGSTVLVDTSTRMVVGRDNVSAQLDGNSVYNPYVTRRATVVSIPSGGTIWTTLTGWTESVTQGVTVEADGSLTIVYPGFYVTDVAPSFSGASTAGNRSARILINGAVAGYLSIPADANGSTDVPVRCSRVLAQGDNIVIQVNQSSGAALNVIGGSGISPNSLFRVSL